MRNQAHREDPVVAPIAFSGEIRDGMSWIAVTPSVSQMVELLDAARNVPSSVNVPMCSS